MNFCCALLISLLNIGFVENDSTQIKRSSAIEFYLGQELRLNPNL